MKVYVVESLDTNYVTSIDKIFLDKKDAQQYIDVQEKINETLEYFIKEHVVWKDYYHYYNQIV